MLTQKDLSAMRKLMELVFDEKMILVKEELFRHLPSKDEFYEEMERIYKKLEDLEVEKNILVHRVADHDGRISSLE